MRMPKSLAVVLAVAAAYATVPAATAADMPARQVYKAAVAPVAYGWTGFYGGFNAGGAWGHSDVTTTTLDPPVTYFAGTSTGAIAAAGAQSPKTSGFTGGVQLGYNWQAGGAVFGIETDFSYFRQRGSSSATALYPCCAPTSFTIASQVSTDWLLTLRPRVGFTADNWLFYVTGGLAATHLKADWQFTDTFAAATESASLSKTKIGWALGAGAEYAVGGGWSLKAEYLYVDFGRESVTSNNLVAGTPRPTQTFTHTADLSSHVARVGVNYKFGGPVVARY